MSRMFHLADYIVRVVFVGFLVFGLFFLPRAAFGNEVVEPATVGIAPAWVQLPMLIPVTVISALNLAAWMGIGYAIMQYMVLPIASGIAIMFSIWVVFKGLALLIGAYSGNRGR